MLAKSCPIEGKFVLKQWSVMGKWYICRKSSDKIRRGNRESLLNVYCPNTKSPWCCVKNKLKRGESTNLNPGVAPEVIMKNPSRTE